MPREPCSPYSLQKLETTRDEEWSRPPKRDSENRDILTTTDRMRVTSFESI